MNNRPRRIALIVNNVNNNDEQKPYHHKDCLVSFFWGGIGSFIGGGLYTLASYSVGNSILHANEWNSGALVASTCGGVGTLIPGIVASSALVVRYPTEQSFGLSPFGRKYSTALAFFIPLISEVICQGLYCIPSFISVNAHLTSSSPPFPKEEPLLDNTSMMSPTLLGNAIFTGGCLIAYGGYKLIKKRFASHEQANIPENPQQEGQAEGIPYQLFNQVEPQENENPGGLILNAEHIENEDGENYPNQESPGEFFEAKLSLESYIEKIKENLKDPVHLGLMTDPKVLKCGHSIDNKSLIDLEKANSCKCPICRKPITQKEFKNPRDNYSLKSIIPSWSQEEKSQAEQNNEVKLQNENLVVINININDDVRAQEEIAKEINEEKLNPTNQLKLNLLNIYPNSINKQFLCPLTKQIMNEPVRASDGVVYEKVAIMEYIFNKQNLQQPILSPITGESLTLTKGKWFSPAKDIEVLIDRFFEHKHKSKSHLARNSLFNRIFNWASSKPTNNSAATLNI